MTWRERIQAARERGTFTSEDKVLACSWATCAVGEQNTMYPEIVRYERDDLGPTFLAHNPTGIPTDYELVRLGDGATGLYSAVGTNNIPQAENLLNAIEDRVLELKRTHAD